MQSKNNFLFEDRKLAKKLTDYEKKYKKNSCLLLLEFTFPDREKKEFKELFLEYIKRNLNPFKINKYEETTFTLLNEEDYTKRGVLNFLYKTTANDFLIIKNSVKNYRDILLTINSLFRYTILITDNKEDYDLNLSNVCVLYNDNFEEVYECFKDKAITR